MKYILDTHALVWYLTKDRRLGKKAKSIIQGAEQSRHDVIIPVIVLLKAIDIGEKKKVKFKIRELFDFIEKSPNFMVVDLDLYLVEETIKVGRGLDLHDRIILAVARAYDGIILTKDAEIRERGKTAWNSG